MFYSIGVGYVVLATSIFTVVALLLMLLGAVMLDKILRRGFEGVRRDIQMGLAASADVTREEVRQAMRGEGKGR